MSQLRSDQLIADEAKLRRQLSLNPSSAEDWNELSTNLLQQRQASLAEICSQKATQLDATNPNYWANLGLCLSRQQQWRAAADAFRHSLELAPRNARLASDLASALFQLGLFPEAETYAVDALRLDGLQVTAWANYGAALFAQRKLTPAADAFRRATELAPNNAALWSNLGAAEQALGRLTEAKQCLEKSLAINRNDPAAATNYASILSQLLQVEESIQILQNVVAVHPKFAQAWTSLGSALRLKRKYDDAVVALHRALDLAPRQHEVLFTLASVLFLQDKLSEAEELLRQLLGSNPAAREAWVLLSRVLDKQFRREESLAALDRAEQIHADSATRGEALRQSQYAEHVTAERLRRAHEDWAAKYAPAAKIWNHQRPTTQVSTGKPLRIGFVSADFCGHPVGFLACPCLDHLDKQRCQIVCYSDVLVEDALSACFRAAADIWRPSAGLTNDQLVQQIEMDQIDVLIDLMGHTGSRLEVFARKPAPCQISWLGYVGTTGLSAMDFILADQFHVREGEEQHFVEQVLRLPQGYACYSPPVYVPPICPLPALTAGHVVFGCFNNTTKYTPQLLGLWAEVLRRVPTAKLLLKFGSLGDARLRQRVLEEFSNHGIASTRVECEGASPHVDLLASYNRVDIALDTQPYSGGVTTCEALLMGVPVITYPGKTFAGRHATSHLTNAGYPQFVAKDIDGYVNLAVEWAHRLDELATIRSQLRTQLLRSPLCDAPRFAHDFLHVIQQARHSQLAAAH